MSNTVNRLVGVAARLTIRLMIPCLVVCIGITALTFIRAVQFLLNGGGWPDFSFWFYPVTFGALLGLIPGCATKKFKTEGVMSADPYGSTGLLLGFVGFFVLPFVGPAWAIELLEFKFFGATDDFAGLLLGVMRVSVLGGIIGVIFGEIVAFMSGRKDPELFPGGDSRSTSGADGRG